MSLYIDDIPLDALTNEQIQADLAACRRALQVCGDDEAEAYEDLITSLEEEQATRAQQTSAAPIAPYCDVCRGVGKISGQFEPVDCPACANR